jgi:hypothetical protein
MKRTMVPPRSQPAVSLEIPLVAGENMTVPLCLEKKVGMI